MGKANLSLTEEETVKFIELYNKGISYDQMSLEMNISVTAITPKVKELIELGRLTQRVKVSEGKKPRKASKKLPENVVTHQGRVCDYSFCKTCRYHFNDQNKYLCNYADITNKTRVDRDNNAFKGNMWECRVYEPMTKNRKSLVKAPVIRKG